MNDILPDAMPDQNKRMQFFRTVIGKYPDGNFSPVAQWLNGRLIHVSEGCMEMEFVVREDMCNPMKLLHGGIAATILDDIVGTMVYALGRENAFVSVNLNCDYLHPAKVGDRLNVQAKVIRAGKTIIHAEARITGEENLIIAKCTCNLAQTQVRLPF